MWANGERDGRPAEYRWRPLFNGTKLMPSAGVPCSNAARMRKRLKFAGVPQPQTNDLSRYWAEVHHIVGTCGGDIAA